MGPNLQDILRFVVRLP